MSKRERSPSSRNLPKLQLNKRQKSINTSILYLPLSDTVMETNNEPGDSFKGDGNTESMDHQSAVHNVDQPLEPVSKLKNIADKEKEACASNESANDTSFDENDKANCDKSKCDKNVEQPHQVAESVEEPETQRKENAQNVDEVSANATNNAKSDSHAEGGKHDETKEACLSPTMEIASAQVEQSNDVNVRPPNDQNASLSIADLHILFETIELMSEERVACEGKMKTLKDENNKLKNEVNNLLKNEKYIGMKEGSNTLPGEGGHVSESEEDFYIIDTSEALTLKIDEKLENIRSSREMSNPGSQIDSMSLLNKLVDLARENGRLQYTAKSIIHEKITQLSNDKKLLKERCAEFEIEKIKMKEELKHLKVNLEERSKTITQLSDENRLLREEKYASINNYDVLKNDNSHTVDRCRELQNEKGKLQDCNTKLVADLARSEEARCHLETQFQDLNKTKRAAENLSDQKDGKIERLENENIRLNNQVKHKDDDITKLKEQTQYLMENINKLEEDNKKELENNSTLRDKVQTLEKEIAGLEKNRKEMKESLLEKDKELEKLKRKKPINCGVPSALYNDHRLTGVLSQLQAQMTSDVGMLVMAPKEEEALRNEKFILIPCVNASRVGSDIEGTLAKIGSTGAAKLILLVFHHLAKHNSRIHTPTRDRIEPRQVALCSAVIDVVYWHHDMYACDANTKAVNELKMALQMT